MTSIPLMPGVFLLRARVATLRRCARKQSIVSILYGIDACDGISPFVHSGG